MTKMGKLYRKSYGGKCPTSSSKNPNAREIAIVKRKIRIIKADNSTGRTPEDKRSAIERLKIRLIELGD
jgi:hypothetical protein